MELYASCDVLVYNTAFHIVMTTSNRNQYIILTLEICLLLIRKHILEISRSFMHYYSLTLVMLKKIEWKKVIQGNSIHVPTVEHKK